MTPPVQLFEAAKAKVEGEGVGMVVQRWNAQRYVRKCSSWGQRDVHMVSQLTTIISKRRGRMCFLGACNEDDRTIINNASDRTEQQNQAICSTPEKDSGMKTGS